MPGAPYLYYGEEIGMLGLKPDEHIREPFIWDVKEKDGGRATWIEAKYSTDATVTPLEAQRKDPNSYFNHYKALIKLRNSYPALATGSLEILENKFPKSVMAFGRKSADQEVFVVHNLGSEPVEIEVPAGFEKELFKLGTGALTSGKLTLEANSSIVYLKK